MIAPAALPDLGAYRRFVVAFSGGKDSLAALLHLLNLGVPAHAIELYHHAARAAQLDLFADETIAELTI